MNRDTMIQQVLTHQGLWDILVIGGGATGVGIAVDAASRGYQVLLLEQHDFGKGTSSRSTKLIHGGVRYLEQGNLSLVREALQERGLLRKNAPHLVKDLAFVVPSYTWWESPYYGFGLNVYNFLSGKYRLGKTERLTKEQTLLRLPTINVNGLRGGVVYFDGQFDDARLLINLVATAVGQGATLLNYAKVLRLLRNDEGVINGVSVQEMETGDQWHIHAKVVINATGPFTDTVRQMADSHATPMITPSQGIHLVFDKSFLPGDCAIMVPHTSDGRVMFAIPWHHHTLVGTTDTPVEKITQEPQATEQEIELILETSKQYLRNAPTRADVLSIFAGIRPLVKGDMRNTAALSRDHTIHCDHSGLLTVTGGKWTTYRRMAEDAVNHAIAVAKLMDRPCITRNLPVYGYHEHSEVYGQLHSYGTDAPAIQKISIESTEWSKLLDSRLPYTSAEVIWATRHEMARTIEDVLARRTRALFLNAHAARMMAPQVAQLMAGELGRNEAWQNQQIDAFMEVSQHYLIK